MDTGLLWLMVGTERLVLASGGVTRDFLTIFRKAIDVARERGKTYRGERINAGGGHSSSMEIEHAKFPRGKVEIAARQCHGVHESPMSRIMRAIVDSSDAIA
jgi:hypothetical protein